MQRIVHAYLKALEAGDADKAAALFIPDGWVESQPSRAMRRRTPS